MQDFKLITLTKGREAIVDALDYDWLVHHKWHCYRTHSDTYIPRTNIKTNGRYRCMIMSRLIMGATDPVVFVDHKNGNTLDNRRENLRFADRIQNRANSKLNRNNQSGFKGVYWDTQRNKWKAEITIDGKLTRLGRFDSPEAAHRAYCEAAALHFGEFARFA